MSKLSRENRKGYMDKYYTENNDRISKMRKARRAERRDEINTAARVMYAADEDVRKDQARRNTKYRKKLIDSIDPILRAVREEQLARRRARHTERMTSDPDYAARHRANCRTAYQKRKHENSPPPNS